MVKIISDIKYKLITNIITGGQVVREMEGVLTRYPKETIGIIVASDKNKFTNGVIDRARTAVYHDIILTDKDNLHIDLIDYIDNRISSNFNFNFKYFFISFFLMCVIYLIYFLYVFFV